MVINFLPTEGEQNEGKANEDMRMKRDEGFLSLFVENECNQFTSGADKLYGPATVSKTITIGFNQLEALCARYQFSTFDP